MTDMATPNPEPALHRGPERRRAVLDSYARVLQALDAGGVGTWEWDARTDRLTCSATHDRLFGYAPGSSPETLEGLFERLHPDDRPIQRAAVEQSRLLGIDYWQEFRVVLADDSVRWIQRVGRFLGSDHAMMAGMSIDVTERRRSEEAVRQTEQRYREALAALYQAERVARAEAEDARMEAEAANRSKTEFLAIMSHELRTPLNAIAGYTDLLALGIRGPITSEQREDLQRIQRSQQHLLGLINQVLNYARIETGALSYELLDVPLYDLLHGVEGLVAPQLSAKEIGYEFTVPGPAARCARGSRPLATDRLSCWATLSSSPRKAAESRSTALPMRPLSISKSEIRAFRTFPADRSDQHLFEPFVQVDADRHVEPKARVSGWRSAAIWRAAWAAISQAPSHLGKGSTFTLRLPRSERPRPAPTL